MDPGLVFIFRASYKRYSHVEYVLTSTHHLVRGQRRRDLGSGKVRADEVCGIKRGLPVSLVA